MGNGSHFKLKKTMLANAIQILDENKGEMSLLEYHNYSKENDPTYYIWLFGSDSGNISDYGVGMTPSQIKEMDEFDNSVSSLQEIRENFELN